jgi:hypothetical protein
MNVLIGQMKSIKLTFPLHSSGARTSSAPTSATSCHARFFCWYADETFAIPSIISRLSSTDANNWRLAACKKLHFLALLILAAIVDKVSSASVSSANVYTGSRKIALWEGAFPEIP